MSTCRTSPLFHHLLTPGSRQLLADEPDRPRSLRARGCSRGITVRGCGSSRGNDRLNRVVVLGTHAVEAPEVLRPDSIRILRPLLSHVFTVAPVTARLAAIALAAGPPT